MILVTGGKYQGKEAFAREHFARRRIVAAYEEILAGRMEAYGCGYKAEGIDTSGPAPALKDMQKSILESVEKDLENDPDCVIVLSEIGCGVTPVEAKDRRLRDITGKAGCYLAARAEEVYRITAGLPYRLK